MDSDVIQAFNKALVSMQETKGGLVSKQKVLEITKAAMNAVRYFKHVVFIIERYLAKCRQEFKMPALYVMDSILRQAKKQYKHKDVFAPRFAINLSNTIQNVLTCDSSDRLKVVRVVNLWQAHQIFIEDALDPVLQHCRASGLEVDPTRVEQLVKGDKADMLLYQPQFAERGASFGSSGGSLVGSGGTSLIEMPPIPIIPCERRTPQQQQPRVVPPPPPGPPPATTTPTSTPIGGIGIQHQPSLEERLSQFKKLTTPPATGVSSRANSVSGGTPTAMMSTSTNTLETGPKTPPTLEDQDHRIATGQFVQQSASSISIDSTGLSSTDVLQLLLNGAGLVVPPDIGARPDLLAKVQRFMNERVGESLEIERRREGNIKNLLAREFDYSDEEDEAAAVAAALNSSQSLQSLGPLAGVSREKLLTVARTLFGDAAFQQELRQQFIVQHHQLQHHQQSHVSSSTLPSFQLPDFSLPPPNIVGAAAINGGGMLPKLFMSPPPKLVGSTPLPPGTSPSASAVGFNLAGVPPPSLMSISTSVPSSSSGNNRDRSPPSPSSGKRHHHRDRERERDRDKNRDNFAGAGNGGSGGGRRRSDRNNDRTSLAQSGGRKRNREWTPAGDDKDLRRSSVSPPGTKRERNGDDGVAGRRGDRQTKRSSGRRGERSGRHDEEERERDRDRDKERDQRERERRRIGLPSKTKSDHVLIASRTLWFGRIPSGATESDIVDSVKDIGIPEKVSLVFGRGCAYVTMPDRRLAFKILDRLATKNIRVQNKNVKVDWATIPYVKDNLQLMDIYWDLEQGYAQIPFSKLPDGSVDSLMDGAWLELDTLPSHLKDRYTNTGLKFMEQQQQQQNLLLSTSAAINAQFAHHHHQQQQQHLLQQAAATPSTTTPLVTVTLPQAVMPSVATAAAGLVPAAMFTQAAAAAAAAQMAFAGNLLPFSFPPPNIPPPAIGGGGTTSTVQQQQQQQQAGTGTTTVMQQRQTQPPSGNAVIGSLLSAPASTLASIAGFANVGFAGGGFPPGGFGAAGGGGGGGGQSAGGGRGGGNWAPRGRGGGRGVGGGGGFQQRFNSPGGGTFRPGSGGGSFQMGGNFGGGRGRGSGGGGGGFRGGGRGRGWDGANQQQGGRGGGGRGFGGARGGRGGGPFFAGERMPFREFSGGGEGFGSGANREPFGFGALPPQSESEGNVPAAMPSNNGSSFGGTSGPSQKNEADFKPSGAASSDSFSNTAFGNVTTPTTLKIEPNRFNAPPHPEPFSSDSAPFCAKTEPKMNMFGQQQHQHCSETESDAPPGLD